MRLSLPTALLFLLVACGEKAPSSRADSAAAPTQGDTAQPLPAGEARLAVEGGRIWYKVSQADTGTSLILLHGGPGVGSFYLKPLEALADERSVVRYDQLGTGKSDPTSDTALFTIAHFVRELEALRAHLGYERVHLLGHSWGSILALEYYRAHPAHVASLTLASAALDIPAWERNAKRLATTLSAPAQRAIRVAEATGKFDSPEYPAAVGEFYEKYQFRRPVPADLDSIMQTMNEAMYNYMQGPSEFTITGTLKRYDATPYLKTIAVPTLYTVGEFDAADPATIRRHAAMTPGAKVAVLRGAAHLTTWDATEENVRVVREFLRAADGAAAKRGVR